MKYLLSSVLVIGLACSGPVANAAPHLGMKLAAKRYGQAWNSGSRSALYGQVTGDFAHVFSRMPDNMFRNMPRGGSGSVLSSNKGRGYGNVTVSTPHGVVTFAMVGNGFNWTVADIYKAGDDGRTVSLKSYLDAQLTAREFIRDLKLVGGKSFHDSSSHRMRSAFDQLTADELVRVRETLPPPTENMKPYLVMNGSHATLTVRMPERETTARLTLVREGSWKVDDYSVESPRTSIASFRNSLSTLAAVSYFREYMRHPQSMDPATFTVDGKLRNALGRHEMLRQMYMQKATPVLKHIAIDETGKHVSIAFSDRDVRIEMAPRGDKLAMSQVDVRLGKRWADFAHVIVLADSARQAMTIAGLTQSGGSALPVAAAVTKETVEETSEGIAFASAEEPVADDEVVAVVEPKVEPAVAKVEASPAPVVRQVSYQHNYQPTRTYCRPVKRGLFGRRR